ncbi:ragulator complex protein LAMTOR5 homolog [Oscarella lobularis]|uniref:ragulator complex protein LAMTOR5 homolog n=1 Tax=Oscarella lobularis TaxID=121494 RepID=UPI00331423B8
MESALDKQLDESMAQTGVVGVMCVDQKGLCLGVRGNSTPEGAGHVATLANKARELAPYGVEPVVVLESPGCNVLIKQHNGITLAVNKVL